MKLEDLKHGKTVRFIDASGLATDEEYTIHSVDSMSWTVRLDGVMGSYSIDHIVGFDSTPTIPSDESGTLRTAAAFPTGAPRQLPKLEEPPVDDDDDETSVTRSEVPSIFEALYGMDVVDLLDAMEGHLRTLTAHPDPLVKYHARNALMIQWTIEGLPGGETKKEEEKEEKDENP